MKENVGSLILAGEPNVMGVCPANDVPIDAWNVCVEIRLSESTRDSSLCSVFFLMFLSMTVKNERTTSSKDVEIPVSDRQKLLEMVTKLSLLALPLNVARPDQLPAAPNS